jgi:type IV pilus assembly protein PilA
MKRVQQGFTLIELMIVVAIVGILAAIALPAYQDYVVRSKMSEAEGAIAACKTSVSEYVSTHPAAFPTDAAQAGCNNTNSRYVASITVGSNNITARTVNTGANPECDLTLQSNYVVNSGEITSWTGTFGNNCSSKYVPSAFR